MSLLLMANILRTQLFTEATPAVSILELQYSITQERYSFKQIDQLLKKKRKDRILCRSRISLE